MPAQKTRKRIKRKPHMKWCDSCAKPHRHIHRLDTGGGSGVYLCRGCWAKEMRWRRMRNKTLSKSARFPIRKWRVYKKRK